MKITKEAYNIIKEDIEYYYEIYDLQDSYNKEFVAKLNIAKIYFKNDYEDLKEFKISEKCLKYLLDIADESSKIYVYVLELLEQFSNVITFETDNEVEE